MVHYLLLRFKENTLTEDVINDFADKFDQLEKDNKGIINPQIYRDIVGRPGNMDLMISVEMRSIDDLHLYLESAEHNALKEAYRDIIELQISFDHN